MIHTIRNLTLFGLALALLPITEAAAQLSGSRGGVSHSSSRLSLSPLNPEVAQGYITIEGRAELRIEPTEIRVVLAVTAEADTPAECKKMVSAKISKLKMQWVKSGIDKDNIVEDFISVLPRYEFKEKELGNTKVAREEKTGFLMQSNLHLAVKDDEQAMSAIGIAFDNNVSDIIGFDYWSKELDEAKVKAVELAIKVANNKSKLLLGSFFEKRPPIINVQQATQVVYPESLYVSFSNSASNEYRTSYSRRDIPQIHMFRPKNTYYRGLYPNADVQSKELPMRSEISIVSTVRLYYQSPAQTVDHLRKKKEK